MKNNLLLTNLQNKIESLLEFNPPKEKPRNPIVKIVNKDKFYDIYIFLRDLTKEEVLIKHINNFLILDFSLKSKDNTKINYKRSFYLRGVDINKAENVVRANLIYFKIPKT